VTVLFLSPISVVAPNLEATQGGSYSDHLKGGWLEVRDGVRIVHLNGSYYNMGYQFGTLLKKDCLKSREAWLQYLKATFNITHTDMLGLWNISKAYVPVQFQEEIQGRADALGLTFNDTAIMEVIEQAYHVKKCSHFAAWGPATADGKLYHCRSLDGDIKVINPETGYDASNDQLIIVRHPEGGCASVVVGDGIEVGGDGFNQHGISMSSSFVPTLDTTVNGTPTGIRSRMVLDQACTLEQAITIYCSSATLGWNQIISDGQTAIAIEQSANYNHVCYWNDSYENMYPSRTIDHVIRRGNFFLDPVGAGFDKDVYRKSTFLRFVLNGFGFIKTNYTFYNSIKHYQVLNDAIRRENGKFTANTTMDMMRAVYQGKTNLFYHLLQTALASQGYRDTWIQWVICPQTGEVLLSFSHNGTSAYVNPVHHFNIYELMNAAAS